MTSQDDFDAFLARTLAPPEREEDRAFVARVQQRIRIDAALRSARAATFQRMSVEIMALAAVAAALVWFAGSADASAIAAESPAPVLAGLIGLFMSLVWLMAPRAGLVGSNKRVRAIPAT